MCVQGTVLTSEVRLKVREAPLPCLWLEHHPTFGYRLPSRIQIQNHSYSPDPVQTKFSIRFCHCCRRHSGLFYTSHDGFEGRGGLVCCCTLHLPEC